MNNNGPAEAPGEAPEGNLKSCEVISDIESCNHANEGEKSAENEEKAPSEPATAPSAQCYPPFLPQNAPPEVAQQYYQALMRDHAAAYASAAANAAWAAAQMAAAAADFAAGQGPPPPVPFLLYAAQGGAYATPPGVSPGGMVEGDAFGFQPPSPHFENIAMMPQQSQHPFANMSHQHSPLPMPVSGPPYQYASNPQYHAHTSKNINKNHHRSDASSCSVESEQVAVHRRKRRTQRRDEIPRNIVAAPAVAPAQSSRGKIRRRLRSDGESSSTSNSSCSHRWATHPGSGNYSNSGSAHRSRRRRTQHKKARSDESLLGKTAVAALYEWCSRRDRVPSFVVQRDEKDATSFVCRVYLDTSTSLPENTSSADNNDAEDTEIATGQARNKGTAKQEAARRALQLLCPGVVFEREFVISVTEGLSASGNAANGDNSGNSQAWEDLAPNLAKQLAIGSGSCASSKRALPSRGDDEDYYNTSQGSSLLSDLLFQTIQIDPRTPHDPVFSYQMAPPVAAGGRGRFACTAKLQNLDKLLESKGIGPSKREARHIACANLLALLFPECETMAQVKEAAEEARADYTTTKSFLKSRRAALDDPALPTALKESLESISLGETNDTNDQVPPTDKLEKQQDALADRQLSRKKQLDTLVEKALQKLNDRDEEGRCLPDELTADDVGRTVLRRAEPSDLDSIKKLLSEEDTLLRRKPSFEVEINEEQPAQSPLSCLWSSSSIVLLLCRAIAAYEDPPLGCAVLTIDFSMGKGRLLRTTRIANEPHLPQERFIECLQDFASCLGNYELENSPHPCGHSKRWSVQDAKSIVDSYVVSSSQDIKTAPIKNSALQSVQEESEASDSSNAEKRPAKRQSKPRSRGALKESSS